MDFAWNVMFGETPCGGEEVRMQQKRNTMYQEYTAAPNSGNYRPEQDYPSLYRRRPSAPNGNKQAPAPADAPAAAASRTRGLGQAAPAAPGGPSRESQYENYSAAAGWSRLPPQTTGNAQQSRPQQQQQQQQQATGNVGQTAPGRQNQRAMRARRDSDGDTIIGKGFTKAMKRGVAQAKPGKQEENLVLKADGGFIATIQRGFEGLFGKPTSKEEVLRKRGAVIACEYEAVPGDEIDQRVEFFARRLPEDSAGCLKIFREKKGSYIINDENVNMEPRFRTKPDGSPEKEIFVWWETEDGEQTDPEPLGLYLTHAANVAYEVKQGGNVITQVPDHVRMSFHDEIGTKLTDGSADARFNAMEVAARQARMREEAAVEWREKQNKGTVGEQAMANLAAQERVPSGDGSILQQQVGQAPTPSRGFPVLAAPSAAPPPASSAFPALPQSNLAAPAAFGAMPSLGAPQAGTFMMGSAGQVAGMRGMGMPMPAMAGAGGYPAAMPMQRQGTMYAYGSGAAYPVSVR